MNRVVIIGAGVAGLTLANRLTQRSNLQVVLIDNHKHIRRGLGIWPNSQSILEQLTVLHSIHKCSIPSAAYRNIHGHWLSKTAAISNKVLTVDQQQLIHKLNANLQSTNIKMIRASVHQIDPLNDQLVLVNDNHSYQKIDVNGILVGADGSSSILKQYIHQQQTSIDQQQTHTQLEQIVVTGMIDDSRMDVDYPYESLGRCRITGKPVRFAAIPINTSQGQGMFWFATIVVDNTIAGYFDKQSIDKQYLLDRFSKFHDPITQIIATSFDQHYQNLNVEFINKKNGIIGQQYIDNMILIGDAYHSQSVGHNLAQGASVAIEDAWVLADQIIQSQSQSYQSIFNAFQNHRKKRIQGYYMMSYFTHLISQMDHYQITSMLRNSMRFVPDPINSSIFDYALDHSLGYKYHINS